MHTPHLPVLTSAYSKHPRQPPKHRAGLNCWPREQSVVDARWRRPILAGWPLQWAGSEECLLELTSHSALGAHSSNLLKITPLLPFISSLVHLPLTLMMLSGITSLTTNLCLNPGHRIWSGGSQKKTSTNAEAT